MADLGKTNAQWTRFIGRELVGLPCAMIRELREWRDKYTYERQQCVVIGDAVGDLATLALDGCTLANIDMDAGGVLYARKTDNGGGSWTLDLYKDTGAGSGDKVATGTANTSAAMTLSASNSSGITGSWTVPASPTALAADTTLIMPIVDWRKRARQTLDGTETKDTQSFDDLLATLDVVAANMQASIDAVIQFVALWATGTGRRGQDFSGQSYASFNSDTADTSDASGAVARIRTGFFPDTRRNMADETTGSTQDIVKIVPAGAAATFATNNDGLGAVASHTPRESCPIGTLTMKCTAGGDTDAGGAETFDGRFKVSGTDEEFLVGTLTVKQSFSGPRGIGPLTLTRTYSKTGDASNLIFTAASGVTTSGESNANTEGSAGTLYWSTVANGSNWDISFYKDSARTELVSFAENIAASTAFTTSERNGSGLTISWTTGGTVSATSGTLVCNFFRVENSTDGTSDEFSIAFTHTSAGLIQTVLAEELNTWLNSDTSGSETIGDSFIKANTFAPFAVLDN